jgi:uncharacterized membrane protein
MFIDNTNKFLRNFGAIWFLSLVGITVALLPITIISMFGQVPQEPALWVVCALLGGGAIGLLLRR